MNKILSPDADAASSSLTETPPVTDTHVRHEKNVPAKNGVLLSVCQQVDTQWKATPAISLIWKTQTDYEKDVTRFGELLGERNETGGDRQHLTKDLENLDHQLDDAIPTMKSKINYKFGPADGKSYFAVFGIVHSAANGYELPHDRQGRKSSIDLMVKACTKYGFTDDPYGVPFWTDMQSKYEAALSIAGSTSGDVSGYVGELNTLRTSLRRVLHSILLLLEANYPDTFDQERRVWGFQKENY